MITTGQIYMLSFVITNDNDKNMNEQQLLMKIGDKITEIRHEKGLSLQELADKCNFEKSNLSRIIAGRTNMTVRTLFLISQALDVKLYVLLDVEE